MKKSFCLKMGCLALALYSGSFTSSLAETLTQVPMQGGMIHVGITYHEHADAGMFHVHLDEGIPQLLPLSKSHPQDDFDPSAPWYHHLSPNGMGMAFNRQYGFVMDAESDFLPEGTAIRIRQLEASPDLLAFEYRTSNGGSWNPMFGTFDSDPEFAWALTMFHPAYAAPEGSGRLMATYEVYLVDTATGTRSDHAMAAEFELSWMAGPMVGEPELTISNPIMISWPETFAGYRR